MPALHFVLPCLLALCLIAAQTAQAQQNPNVKNWDLNLAQIKVEVAAENVSVPSLDQSLAKLQEIRTDLGEAIAGLKTEIAPIEARLELIPSSESDDSAPPTPLTEERSQLQSELSAKQTALAQAEDLNFRIGKTVEQINSRKRDLFTQQLLTRGPGVFEGGSWLRGLEAIQRKSNQVLTEASRRIATQAMVSGRSIRLGVGLLVMLSSLFLLFKLRRWAIAWLTRRLHNGGEVRHRASIAVSITVTRLLLPSASVGLVLAWLANSGLLGPLGEALVGGLASAVLVVIGAFGLSSAFFSPDEPKLRISRADDREASRARFWIVTLALIVGLDDALVETGEEALGLSLEALVLINTALLTLGGVTLWAVVGALRPAQSTPDPEAVETEEVPSLLPKILNLLRFIARLAAVAAPVLALFGYYFASRFTFYPLVFSGAVIGVGVLLFYMVSDAVEQLVPEQSEDGSARGLRLIPVVLGMILGCIAIPVLALIWGASTTDLSTWWALIEDGFVVGDVRLSPVDVLSFVLVFSVGYVITRMLQGILTRNVLPLTSMDTGGRDAVTAGLGYVGVILSALIAISATGLDLSNLAIVAGALSVGIGFGLQNIVNNFVSGIILLIERPIKAGDWVELPSGMGYVRKVNVRSTEVQTFDRSTLFVPNSELISSPVINWTHSDMHGRLIVKVGVAYGSEPRKVETILQEIADAHTMLLNRPAPYILFRGFGSDSLDFEIRGVLRDVNWVLNVQSDINYEIARRFEEEDIEIPFAQREVTIKNLADLGTGIAEVAAEAARPMRRTTRKAGPAGMDGDGDGDV